MSFHNFMVLIHRPFLCLSPSSSECAPELRQLQIELAETASSVCTVSAFEITDLCRRYQENYTLQCTVFMIVHYLTTASTVHIVNMESLDAAISIKASRSLQDCIDMLDEISTVWTVAKKAIAIVDQLRMDRRQNMDREGSGEVMSAGDPGRMSLPRESGNGNPMHEEGPELEISRGEHDQNILDDASLLITSLDDCDLGAMSQVYDQEFFWGTV